MVVPQNLPVFVEILVSPTEAIERLRQNTSWLPAAAALLAFFMGGCALQRSAVHHVEILQAVASADAYGHDRTPTAASSIKEPSIPTDLANWIFAFLFVAVGFVLSAVFSALFAMLSGGEVVFARVWASVLSISVPTFGLYSVTSGLIAIARGGDAYATYSDLASSVPSIANLLPVSLTGFWLGFCSSLNPFSLWASCLYVLMFLQVCRVRRFSAYLGATLVLLGGAALQGLLSALSV